MFGIRRTKWWFYNIFLARCLRKILLREWREPLWELNERAIEYEFALKWLSRIYPREVLDVGTDLSAWPHLLANCGFRVTAIDKTTFKIKEFRMNYWTWILFNRHYYIIKDDITKSKITKQFDIVTCISTLEHIPEHNKAVKEMFRLLKPAGFLVLTFPYNEKHYVPDIHKLPDIIEKYGRNIPYICQVFSRRELDTWLMENPCKILEQEYYNVFSGEFWLQGDWLFPPQKVTKEEKHHLICLLIQKTDTSKKLSDLI